MNLFARLFWLMLTRRFRAPVAMLGPCITSFRVWPTDLDVFRHVNNGVYLSLMDLGRIDLMGRSGLLAAIKAHGWFPVVVSQTIQYRRSLRVFQRFDIATRVLAWDEKAILLQQEFVRGGETYATALIRGRFLSKSGPVPMADVIALAGNPAPPANVSDYAKQWNSAQATWQGG